MKISINVIIYILNEESKLFYRFIGIDTRLKKDCLIKVFNLK